jgi:Putative transposase/Transposase zinc-binding domain
VNEHRLEVADVFRQHEQDFLARWGDCVSPQQRKAFRDICACRTAALGARIQQCDHCSHQELIFHSCRNRACPKCQSRARDQWLARTARELLPVPYSHVTFTLPRQLSLLALQNPQVLYNVLFRAVADTLLTIAADPRRLGAELGFLAVLHTWSQQMSPHVHLHCLVPAGGLSLARTRWVRIPNPRFFLPGKVLRKRFRRTFLKLLSSTYRRRKLRFQGQFAALTKATDFDRFVRQLKQVSWVVHVRQPFGGPEQVLKYLARYTHRIAISNGRLVALRNNRVTFRWRDSAHGNQSKLMTLDVVEFIRRFLLHVLPKGFVKIRHFGFLANPQRRAALPLCRTLLQAAEPQAAGCDEKQKLVERRCPCCGVGTLCLVGWVPPGSPLPRAQLNAAAIDTS